MADGGGLRSEPRDARAELDPDPTLRERITASRRVLQERLAPLAGGSVLDGAP